MESLRSVHSNLGSVAVIAFVIALMLAVLAPVAGAAPASCRVTNLRTKVVYEGTGSNLQTAIDEAQRGTQLRVRGVCVGNFTIDTNLQLIGWPTLAYPTSTLNGNAAGTVLTISAGIVSLRDLLITNGAATRSVGGDGGGISNAGEVTLRGSTQVSGNTAYWNGGGIYNFGGYEGDGIYAVATLSLRGISQVTGNSTPYQGGGISNFAGIVNIGGSASVTRNRAGFGGGIYNDNQYGGMLSLEGSSSVSRNVAITPGGNSYGGGIYNVFGSVTMDGSARVNGNRVIYGPGGGIFNNGTLTMHGSVRVNGNSAKYGGGGVYNVGGVTMDGSARVNGNTSSGGGGILNLGSITMDGSARVNGNTAGGDAGGIYNNGSAGGSLTLKGSASVTGNTAASFVGGGILNTGILDACTIWTGAISPNTPDDPPTPTLIAC